MLGDLTVPRWNLQGRRLPLAGVGRDVAGVAVLGGVGGDDETVLAAEDGGAVVRFRECHDCETGEEGDVSARGSQSTSVISCAYWHGDDFPEDRDSRDMDKG